MTGTIDITPDGKSLLIRFPYREDLLEEVRMIRGRRWDRDAKVWRVPADEANSVVGTFRPHGFTIAPEVQGLLAPADDDDQSPTLPFGKLLEPEAPPALSISLLNERVRMCLRKTFSDSVWVVGEVHDYDKSAGRQNIFFTLVEKVPGGNQAAARVDAVLFGSTLELLQPKLKSADGLTLCDGIEVRVLARIDLYPQSGRYQILIEDIDPAFTLGKMALSREAILAELRQSGIHRRNASLPLPLPPLRVGVLTSPSSDGWNDLLQQLEGSGFGFAVTCYAIRVQGETLKPTLLAGLRWFAERADDFDVVCVVRGGGSRTDLAWFDDLEIARATALLPIKVICGIGHERDQSVLDVITHSEKTPTAVGATLVDAMRETLDALDLRTEELGDAVRGLFEDLRARLAEHGERLADTVDDRVTRERQGLTSAAHRLTLGTERLVARQRARLAVAAQATAHRTRTAIERAGHALERHSDKLRLLDPRRVLERGYALVRREGKVVRARELEPGMELDISLVDGDARATTTDVTPNDDA